MSNSSLEAAAEMINAVRHAFVELETNPGPVTGDTFAATSAALRKLGEALNEAITAPRINFGFAFLLTVQRLLSGMVPREVLDNEFQFRLFRDLGESPDPNYRYNYPDPDLLDRMLIQPAHLYTALMVELHTVVSETFFTNRGVFDQLVTARYYALVFAIRGGENFAWPNQRPDSSGGQPPGTADEGGAGVPREPRKPVLSGAAENEIPEEDPSEADLIGVRSHST